MCVRNKQQKHGDQAEWAEVMGSGRTWGVQSGRVACRHVRRFQMSRTALGLTPQDCRAEQVDLALGELQGGAVASGVRVLIRG